MSWWNQPLEMTLGELIMACFAGIGMAVCVWAVANAIATVILDIQANRAARKRREQIGAGDFPGSPW